MGGGSTQSQVLLSGNEETWAQIRGKGSGGKRRRPSELHFSLQNCGMEKERGRSRGRNDLGPDRPSKLLRYIKDTPTTG